MIIQKSDRQESRIEYNVAVIRNESIIPVLVTQRRCVHVETIAVLVDDIVEQFVEKCLLYLQIRLTLIQLCSKHFNRYPGNDICQHCLK